MGKKALTPEQEKELVILYQNNQPIQKLREMYGLGSNQTVYSILKRHGIAKRQRPVVRTIGLTVDEETDKIIRKVNPPNISAWICYLIRRAYQLNRFYKGD